MKTVPKVIGEDYDTRDKTEAENFAICPGCGEQFDMRDLVESLQHTHGHRPKILWT